MENKTVNKKKLLEILVITLFLTYGIIPFIIISLCAMI